MFCSCKQSGCARLRFPKWELIPIDFSWEITGKLLCLVLTLRVALLENLIAPFLTRSLEREQLRQLELHLELLLRWNAKISLTAIRDRQEIASRHFGESLFAGEQLNPADGARLADLGSGAGFPGLPIAVLFPRLEVILIESQQKKVAFLREALRSLELNNATVHAGRAENSGIKAGIVTLRAVEHFETVLPTAAALISPQGRLALLIGAGQVKTAIKTLSQLNWNEPIQVPESRQRVLLIGEKDK